MKKIASLCLLFALALFALAGCRGVAEKPFAVDDFIPGSASVKEQSPGHAVLELPATEENHAAMFAQTVTFYQEAIAFVGARQVSLDDGSGAYWSYTGTYGEDGRALQISVRDAGTKIQVLVSFLGEGKN